MQTIYVQPNPNIVDPLAAFRTEEGARVLALFQEGAVLKVWRHSTPYHWWLEHADGRDYHWEADTRLRSADAPDVGLLVRLGEVCHAEGPLTAAGKPSKEHWTFSEAALEKAQATWNFAQQCAANWADKAGTYGGTLANLSPLAQSAVLTLRSKTRLPMRGELLDVLLELNEAGLLDVHAEGHATLRVPAKSLALPKGRPLKVERVAA
jgi:hypothetical protein